MSNTATVAQEIYDRYGHLNTVAVVDDQIVIVGEKHSGREAKFSHRLANNILTDAFYDVDAVAVERPPNNPYPTRGAMGAVRDYAGVNDVPMYMIDRRWESRVDADVGAVLSVANSFADPIDPDGDVTERSAEYARRAVFELFGSDVYTELYKEREALMAILLRIIQQNHDGLIVAAVGAFHVKQLAILVELLEHHAASLYGTMPASRRTDFDSESFECTDDRLKHWPP